MGEQSGGLLVAQGPALCSWPYPLPPSNHLQSLYLLTPNSSAWKSPDC